MHWTSERDAIVLITSKAHSQLTIFAQFAPNSFVFFEGLLFFTLIAGLFLTFWTKLW